jgi:hypothetical protein
MSDGAAKNKINGDEPVQIQFLRSKFRDLVLDLRLEAEHLGDPEGVDSFGDLREYSKREEIARKKKQKSVRERVLRSHSDRRLGSEG